MNVYDRLVDQMETQISKLDAYIEMDKELHKDDRGMRLQLSAKKEAYQRVIELIREDEFEWGG